MADTPTPAAVEGGEPAERALTKIGIAKVRMRVRIDAIMERDKTVDAAVAGVGVGIGFLLCRRVVDALEAAEAEIERLRRPDTERQAVEAIAHQVYALAEDTAEKYADISKRDDTMGAFARGRITEAKSIAKAINAIMSLSPPAPKGE